MARCDETALAELALQLEREDPELARALTGFSTTDPPARSSRRSGWLLLAAAVALMAVAITISHGLLFATGLLIAAIGQHRLEKPHEQGRPSSR